MNRLKSEIRNPKSEKNSASLCVLCGFLSNNNRRERRGARRGSHFGFRFSDFLLAMEAWWKLAWAAIRIRIPFGRERLLQQALNTGAMTRPARRVDPIQTVTFVKALERGRRFHPKGMDCLEQSLALVWMLRRRGQPATLRIGCRRDGPEFRFHAWVTGLDGTPLESSDIGNRFAPFASLSCRSGFPA
jgi:hypothetical protein